MRPLASRPEPVPEPARLELSAPAKLNLGLRVLGKRPDGYHLLESLFVPIDLADDVEVEVERHERGRHSGDATIDLKVSAGERVSADEQEPAWPSSEAVPADGRNLAVIAAAAFLRQAVASPRGPLAEGEAGVRSVRIQLRKRIPAGAGLGGGSSDAGAVLRALSRLVPEGPSGTDLERIALEVGADVPFFLDPRPALVTGIGEKVQPTDGLPPLSLLLANPGLCVSTAEVFAVYDALTAPKPGSTLRPPSKLGADRDALTRLQACENDLEAAAIRLCPPLARLRNRIHGLGATRVGMSGSGATVYGVFANVAEARAALKSAAFEPPIWARVTRSLG